MQKRLYQHVQHGQQELLETGCYVQVDTCLRMLAAAVDHQLDLELEGIDML